VIKKAKTKSCLFLEVNERLPHKGLAEPGRRNSTKGMNSPLSRVYTTKETEGEKQNLRRRSNLEETATLEKINLVSK
jgi:hypothetical protein